jgi:hypothetical protein
MYIFETPSSLGMDEHFKIDFTQIQQMAFGTANYRHSNCAMLQCYIGLLAVTG